MSGESDHDLLIRMAATQQHMVDDLRDLKTNMPSKDSVTRAHGRIDYLQKILLGVAAVAAVEAVAILKMLLFDKG